MFDLTVVLMLGVSVLVNVWLVRDRLRAERVVRKQYDKREQKLLDRVMEPDYCTLKSIQHRSQQTENRKDLEQRRIARGRGELVKPKEDVYPEVGDMM